MKFSPQPCLALPESLKLRAKQAHAKAAKRDRFSASSFLKFRIPHFAFPNKIPPFRPLRPLREQSAFSLTEVVIAMGVAAVAFTSIIALFPLGLNMSKESYEATQAALIAQTIMADLKDALSTKDASGNYAKLIQKGGETFSFDSQNYTPIVLNGNTGTTFYLAYKELPRNNSTLKPFLIRPSDFSASLPNWYREGTNGSFAVVKVTINPTFIMGASSSANAQKIDVWVETPGKLFDTNRVQFLFTGVIPQA
jgi:type II secretory pathway pseudopilin PulG